MASEMNNPKPKKDKKQDGKFHSKNIKHDPKSESAKAVFSHEDRNRR